MRRSRFALAVAMVAGMFAFAGCGGNDTAATTPTESPAASPAESPTASPGGEAGTPAAGEGFAADARIGVALPQKTSENWVLAEQLFNDGLAAKGFTPDVQFADGGVSEQQAQIEAMIAQGAKVIVIGAIDGGQLGTQLQMAHDEGIKIIAYDRLLMNTDNVDLYVAFDPYRVGELQGQALLDGLAERKAAEGPPWNIELIAGSPDDANAPAFFNGAMSVLQPKIDDGTLVIPSGQTTFDAVATQGWLAQNAQNRMDTVMAGFYAGGEKLSGMLSPNDTLARAALTAVQQAGGEVPVITGQDSEVESVRSIMEGVQYMTIYKDTRELVAQTIDQVVRAQKGEAFEVNDTTSFDNGNKIVPTFAIQPKVVTKANACTMYDGDPVLGPVIADYC